MKNTFANIIQTPSIKYKHAKGMRDIFGKEFHLFHELFLFIGGNAFFATEKSKIKLKPYTLIVIPENTIHSFQVDGDEADYERYIFNFYSTKELSQPISRNMNRVSIIEAPPQSLIDDFMVPDNSKYSSEEKELLVMAKLTAVLVELGYCIPSVESISTQFGEITEQCLLYIGQNIHRPLSVEDISKELHYSRSGIMRAFKHDLHMPPYKYIVEKKLIYAHKDIRAGKTATEVSQKYGFSDYSCFYRHYKKHFGVSPSEKDTKW